MTEKPTQLIVQFKIGGDGASEDLDALIRVEDELASAFRQSGAGEVDGHDIGSGEMNIFIVVPDWRQGVQCLMNHLKSAPWATNAVAAKRDPRGAYEVVWPENYKGQFSIK
jgi:hypothetical protein